MATTKNRLLDLTRLVSRAGRPMTGVDRVEFAYLEYLLADALPLFGLVRTSLGYVLLDQSGCNELRSLVQNDAWDKAGPLARLAQRQDPLRARAETTLRRICLDRCLPHRLTKMLKRHVPVGASYVNTGHINLTRRVIAALRSLPETRISVLVHDTIPLDYPQFQRPGTPERFAGFLRRVGEHADLVICNSDQTRRDLLRHLAPKTPQTLVAHLGVPLPQPGPAPKGAWSDDPYFVSLGTIEPRKNHAFLLQLWKEIPDAHLLICGSRGWNNDAVFASLDDKPPRVHELPGMSDAEVFGLLQRSAGLLFPSFAEGYGLPPIEAAALGVPVLCNDLGIFHEVLGDIPIYAPVSDGYLWATQINRLVNEQRARQGGKIAHPAGIEPPSWDAHFKSVLTLI